MYCSIDLELSGFDPTKSEILEIGLVFFKYEENKGLVITEKWTKTFKPKKPVSVAILALTGLTQEELNESPELSEYHEEIQSKLRNMVLVGHNLSLDIKFLQAFGIELSGKYIDTLDLVQIFLPTYHSYNLENLIHYFKISHGSAHRALIDSLSVVSLLTELLKIYQSFDRKLQNEIKKLAESMDFEWLQLLLLPITGKIRHFNKKQRANSPGADTNITSQYKDDKYFLGFGYSANPDEILGSLAIDQNFKNVLVVPDVSMLRRLVSTFLITPYASRLEVFSNKHFQKLLRKKTKTPDEIRFILKILVWQYQTKNMGILLSELNLNFSGNQFLRFVTPKKTPLPKTNLIVCTHEQFIQDFKLISNHYNRVIIYGLPHFELKVCEYLGGRVNWGQILYSLKSIYNPETDLGNMFLKERVIDLLAKTDLFFGMINIFLIQKKSNRSMIALTEIEDYRLQQLRIAAEKYVINLKSLAFTARSAELKLAAIKIEKFFENSSGMVSWIEFADNYCALNTRPIKLNDFFQKLNNAYKHIVYSDVGLNSVMVSYYSHRFNALTYAEHMNNDYNFYSFVKERTKNTKLLKTNSLDLPMVIIFSNQTLLKKFYEDHYKFLKSLGSVLALHLTGGATKIIRNFGIHGKSIALITYDFLKKYSEFHLPVKTVYFCPIESKIAHHPYMFELENYYKNKNIHLLSVEQANLERLTVKMFFSKKLKSIFVENTSYPLIT